MLHTRSEERLVAKGYSQKNGVHCDVPVVQATTIRLILTKAAVKRDIV